jgi:hypothetical protein
MIHSGSDDFSLKVVDLPLHSGVGSPNGGGGGTDYEPAMVFTFSLSRAMDSRRS